MMLLRNLVLICCLLVSAASQAKKFEGLALTPPMGWNSWNTFACEINEDLIKEMADTMVKNGMQAAGYEYINIDDCWHGERDAQGNIQVSKTHFPSGMKALADYVHSKGLKLGLYSDAGWQTCGGHPGSRGYEFQDAKQYASWGIDYLKYDWCNTEGLKAEGAYLTMREALYQAGRPMVFSLCEWGDNKPWEWAKDVGHLWRTTGDIYPCFDCEYSHGTWSSWGMLKILDMQKGLRKYAGPGHWNDPDMMEVGNGMSEIEDRSHFAMWAMLAAPLIAGNDLRTMKPQTLAVLTNKGIIAIDQDPLGIQGFIYADNFAGSSLQIWFKPLQNGDWAMAILNRGEQTAALTFDWKNEKVEDDLSQRATLFSQRVYRVKNLWTGQALQNTSITLHQDIAAHDTLILRLTAQ
jgi:alpha-galactosidase